MTIIRRGEGAPLWSGEHGGQGVLVAGTGPPDVVELGTRTLAPTEVHASEAHTPGTKELIQVQRGSVTVEVGDQSVILRVGDAITFGGDITHSYANRGSRPARFNLAVFEPGVGSDASQVGGV